MIFHVFNNFMSSILMSFSHYTPTVQDFVRFFNQSLKLEFTNQAMEWARMILSHMSANERVNFDIVDLIVSRNIGEFETQFH